MTMPVLVSKYREKVLQAQYEKSKNISSNGFNLMMARNEINSVFEMPFLNCGDDECLISELKKYFSIAEVNRDILIEILPDEYATQDSENISLFNWADVPLIFTVTDGMTYGLNINQELESLEIFTDVNSGKNPNIIKKDLYKFRFLSSGKLADVSDELEKQPEVKNCGRDSSVKCTLEECQKSVEAGHCGANGYCVSGIYNHYYCL